MKPRSRARLSKWLLAAVLAVGMTSSGNAMINTGGPSRPTNQCVYCINFLGWIICITTTEPIPGVDDITACRL